MDKIYEILKDIQLVNGSSIKSGTNVYNIHGVYYMDGGMLPKEYQSDFAKLIEYESNNGWNYIVPIKMKEKKY
jgi:hypothetical protein